MSWSSRKVYRPALARLSSKAPLLRAVIVRLWSYLILIVLGSVVTVLSVIIMFAMLAKLFVSFLAERATLGKR